MAILSDYLRNKASTAVERIGSRLGVPESGISEWIAGSNNYYGQPANTAPQSYASTGQSSTQNMSYAPQMSYAPSGGSVLGVSTGGNTGGGSSSGGGGTQQSSGNPYANIQPSGPSREEIDSAFNPILDVYNQAESNLRSQLPGLISEAEAQAAASRSLLGNQRTSANEMLGQQEQSTETQRARQSAQQRQTLQELQLANQQRFGGASSAGLGASELQGREFQRSQFGIQENAQQALQAIGQQKMSVEREYQQGLQQLEVNRQQAVNDINRKFQDRLLEINARRGETEAAKAQARMQAVQDLRNQAFQINVARAQFEADLRSQAQQNLSYLTQAENQFTGAGQAGVQAYNQFAETTPTGMSQISQQTTGTTNPALQGQMSRRPEESVGQTTGMTREDLLRGTNPLGIPTSFNNFQLGQGY